MRRPRVPTWVTEWFANDPFGQKLAVNRYHQPVTTEAERMAASTFTLERGIGCTSCGRFAFPKPTLCYWCQRRS